MYETPLGQLKDKKMKKIILITMLMSAVFAQADECEAETIDTQCNALDSQSDREECRRYYYLLCENTLTEDELKEIEALEEADRKWAAEKKRKREEEIAKKEAERLAKLEKEEERLAKKAEIARQIDEWDAFQVECREYISNAPRDKSGNIIICGALDDKTGKPINSPCWTGDEIDAEERFLDKCNSFPYLRDTYLTEVALMEFSELTTEAFGEDNNVLPLSFYFITELTYTRKFTCSDLEGLYPDASNIIGLMALTDLRNRMGAYNMEFVSIDLSCVDGAFNSNTFLGTVVVDIAGEGTEKDKIDAVKLAHKELVQSVFDASDNNLELDPN